MMAEWAKGVVGVLDDCSSGSAKQRTYQETPMVFCIKYNILHVGVVITSGKDLESSRKASRWKDGNVRK